MREFTSFKKKRFVIFPRFITMILQHVMGSDYTTFGERKFQSGTNLLSLNLLKQHPSSMPVISLAVARARFLEDMASFVDPVDSESESEPHIQGVQAATAPQALAMTSVLEESIMPAITPSPRVVLSEPAAPAMETVSFTDLLFASPSPAPAAKRQCTFVPVVDINMPTFSMPISFVPTSAAPVIDIPVSMPQVTTTFIESVLVSLPPGASALSNEARLSTLKSQVQQLLLMQQQSLAVLTEMKAKMDAPPLPPPPAQATASRDVKRLKHLFRTYHKSMKISAESYEARLDAYSKIMLDSLKENLNAGMQQCEANLTAYAKKVLDAQK